MTKPSNNPLDTLQEIRTLMERSSRFISLSGLSGVSAGFIALIGASIAYWRLGILPFSNLLDYEQPLSRYLSPTSSDYLFFGGLAAIIFVLAISSGIIFTTRKARQKGQKIWDALTRRLLFHLAVPLFVGGVFCLALLRYNLVLLIAPATLLFYGLSLVNASKYTLNDVQYLGLSEIALGLIGLFIPGYGLELWSIGFGLLHIIYGFVMYYRYEKTEA